MKNFEWVLNDLNNDIRKLASTLVEHCFYEDFDYDYDENMYSTGVVESYACSDGEVFDSFSYDEALKHEIEWLLSEKSDY